MVVIPNEAVVTTDDVKPVNDMQQSSSDVLDALACVVDTNDVVDTNVENTSDVADSGEEHPDVVGPSQESLNSTTKRSRLKSVILKITRYIDHSFTLGHCYQEIET